MTMLSSCLSLIFWLSTITLSDFQVPLSLDVGVASVGNLYCSNLSIGAMDGTFNSSHWMFSTGDPSLITCSVDIEWGELRSTVFLNSSAQPVDLNMRKTPDADCMCKRAAKEQCEVSFSVSELSSTPPDPLLDVIFDFVTQFLNTMAKPLICDTGMSLLADELRNSTVNPLLPYPDLLPNATPLDETVLFRALVNVVNDLPEILGLKSFGSLGNATTLHLNLTSKHGIHLTPNTVELLMDGLVELGTISSTDQSEGIPEAYIDLVVPRPFSVSFDVSLKDFQYDPDTTTYSITSDHGLSFYNLRTSNLGELDGMVSRLVDPAASFAFDYMANMLTNATPDDNETEYNGRFVFFTQKEDFVESRVEFALQIFLGLLGLVILAVVAGTSVWRHRRNPVKNLKGVPLSLARVVIEDIVLTFLLLSSCILFILSNVAIGATLVVGREFEMYSFSLSESIVNLFNAGLYPLAILVVFFSGVYPYIKIIVIFTWTIILQKPDSAVLLIVNFFGKFLFIDSFAVIIMTAGLQLPGIAEIKFLMGFYMFVVATMLSIVAGNYATTLWRRNTTLYKHETSKDAPDTISEGEVDKDDSADLSCLAKCKAQLTTKRILLATANGIVVTVCVVLPWVFPCIEYKVYGVVSLIEPNTRRMTLYQLNEVSWFCLVTSLVTLVITPILYAILYPSLPLFASWSACDAFLITCIFGVLKLGQFVEFIVGEGMTSLFHAEARLLWPLIPLLLASVWQWILVNYRFGKRHVLFRLWLKLRSKC